MENKAEIEIVRRIHFDGQYLTVKDFPDTPDTALSLTSEGGDNPDYWGKIDLTLDIHLALALGQALVDAATEKLKKAGKL